MTVPVQQSDIADAADELFLDTADDGRLDIVTSNLGLDRPTSGYNDDNWRAVAKQIMLRAKLVRNSFYRIVEISYGPQYSRVGTLAKAASVGDTIITVTDATPFVQVGSLTLDAGTANEETAAYGFVNYTTGEIFLNGRLAKNHTNLTVAGVSNLVSDISIGAVALPVFNSGVFPTSGFPYTVLLDQGTVNEEAVTISANNTGTNTLTCSATVKAHVGVHAAFLKTVIGAATVAKRTFIKVTFDTARFFQVNSWVRINKGGGSQEYAFITDIDIVNDFLIFKSPLANAHSINETVEQLKPSTSVTIATLWQKGTYWDIFETAPRRVTLYLPSTLIPSMRAVDASRMHNVVQPAFSTTLASATLVTDTQLTLNTTDGLPVAGMLLVNGAQIVSYVLNKAITGVLKIQRNAGVTTLTLRDSTRFPTVGVYKIRIGTGSTIEEKLVLGNNPSTGVLTLSGTTVYAHSIDSPVTMLGIENLQIVDLDQAIGTVYGGGTVVSFYQVPYVGTSLIDGNVRVPIAIRLNHFAGPYVFDLDEYSITSTATTLTAAVLNSTYVMVDQRIGCTCLEVQDVSLWPAPAFTAFTVAVGVASGYQEDRTCIDRLLKSAGTTTLNAGASIGDFALSFTSSTNFPQSDGVAPAGYRILINKGNVNAEIISVAQNNRGTGAITLMSALTKNHVNGETVELMNDVIQLDTLQSIHYGAKINPSAFGHVVTPYTSKLSVSSVLNFPTNGGIVALNYKNEITAQRQRITNINLGLNKITLVSSAQYPTTNYPYPIVVGSGTPYVQWNFVTNNNTGTNTLTLQNALSASLQLNDIAKFTPGTSEFVTYQSVSGTDLVLNPSTLLSTHHYVGEGVRLSVDTDGPLESGYSYAFRMPPDVYGKLTNVFDFIRAAGVQLRIVSTR